MAAIPTVTEPGSAPWQRRRFRDRRQAYQTTRSRPEYGIACYCIFLQRTHAAARPAQAQLCRRSRRPGGGRRRSRPIIISNQGPLAVTNGTGNVVQQQSATSRAIAQQLMAPAGGALNLVTGSATSSSAPGTR